MKTFRLWVFAALGVLLSLPLSAGTFPRDYHPILGWVNVQGQSWLALRAWQASGPHVLAVNPLTAQTQVLPLKAPPSQTWSEVLATARQKNLLSGLYFRLRSQALREASPWDNAGIRQWPSRRRGAWLSFDLCPSSRPLDRWVFRDLLAMQPKNTALPVFLEVSGRWMATHVQDLAWLYRREAQKQLDITWVSHGEFHPYNPRVPWRQTFDLTPGLNFEQEVLGPEKRLLAGGQLPSVWYRFPGLISDSAHVHQLLAWGLIPLASGAWLNKGDPLREHDIVLVHGNGNEERGLELLMAWTRHHQAALKNGQWSWLGRNDFR